MRVTPTAIAALAVSTTLTGLAATGCHSRPPAEPVESATAEAGPPDYTALLIGVDDIDAPVVFTADPPVVNPGGRDGAAVTFREENDTHVIVDTILILPDPAAAAAEVEAAREVLPGTVTKAPAPVDIGTGGTTVSGESPDGARGLTVLRFAEGRAFVTLEFNGPPGISAPREFVADVGRKQLTAIRNGLPG